MHVSGSATLSALLLGVPAGYGIAKAQAKASRVLLLIARITPGLSYLIPLFTLFQVLGLIGTVWPIAITHMVITLPIVVWVMIGFFETLPHELEEAARIDGATLWQAFLYVALPLARPGIVVGAILSFISSWNNFIFGVVLAGRTTRTHAGRRLQHADLRGVRLGPARRRRDPGDAAGADPHDHHPEGDRAGAVGRRA